MLTICGRLITPLFWGPCLLVWTFSFVIRLWIYELGLRLRYHDRNYLLTEEQKTQRLKCAGNFLKTYKGYNSRVISNLLTGDETWMHMFEPQRRAENKQWKRKDQKRPCIAKRTISPKKMYSIFFNSSGPVVQVPCPSGHTVTGRLWLLFISKA